MAKRSKKTVLDWSEPYTIERSKSTGNFPETHYDVDHIGWFPHQYDAPKVPRLNLMTWTWTSVIKDSPTIPQDVGIEGEWLEKCLGKLSGEIKKNTEVIKRLKECLKYMEDRRDWMTNVHDNPQDWLFRDGSDNDF